MIKYYLMMIKIPFCDLRKKINELSEENAKLNYEKANNPKAEARQEEVLKKISDYNNAKQIFEEFDRIFRIDVQEIIPYLKQKMEYLSNDD